MQLLNKMPKLRLGAKTDVKEIQSHPWFADINFELLLQKKVIIIIFF